MLRPAHARAPGSGPSVELTERAIRLLGEAAHGPWKAELARAEAHEARWRGRSESQIRRAQEAAVARRFAQRQTA